MELMFLILGVNVVGLAALLVTRVRRKSRVAEVTPELGAYDPGVAAWLADVRNGGR